MEKFMSTLLRGMDVSVFAAFFVIALICGIAMVLYRAIRKYDKATGTPEKFRFKFFWAHNWRKWALQLITIPIMMLLCNEFFGSGLTWYYAAAIGVLSGQGSIWARLNKIKLK